MMNSPEQKSSLEQINNPEQQVKVKKNRTNFLLVCAAFLIPIVLAKLALEQQWFNYGVTNQGQLLDKPVSLAELSLEHIQTDKQWLLVFNAPTNCDTRCQQTVNVLSNTYIALGKEMPRVQSVLLNYSSQDGAQDVSRWQQFNVKPLTHPELLAGMLFVVDPLGNIVLTHQPPAQTAALPDFGKAIVADMKKLLKYSRIG